MFESCALHVWQSCDDAHTSVIMPASKGSHGMWMVGGACGADLVGVAAEEHGAPVLTRALQHWVRAVLVRGTGQ
eukprot:2688190-Prymnesium_polylepis.1